MSTPIPFQHLARSQRFRASIDGREYLGLKIRSIPIFCQRSGRIIGLNAMLYPAYKEILGAEGVIACLPDNLLVTKAA